MSRHHNVFVNSGDGQTFEEGSCQPFVQPGEGGKKIDREGDRFSSFIAIILHLQGRKLWEIWKEQGLSSQGSIELNLKLYVHSSKLILLDRNAGNFDILGK